MTCGMLRGGTLETGLCRKENRDQSLLGGSTVGWDFEMFPPLPWAPALRFTPTHADSCRTPVWGLAVTLMISSSCHPLTTTPCPTGMLLGGN